VTLGCVTACTTTGEDGAWRCVCVAPLPPTPTPTPTPTCGLPVANEPAGCCGCCGCGCGAGARAGTGLLTWGAGVGAVPVMGWLNGVPPPPTPSTACAGTASAWAGNVRGGTVAAAMADGSGDGTAAAGAAGAAGAGRAAGACGTVVPLLAVAFRRSVLRRHWKLRTNRPWRGAHWK